MKDTVVFTNVDTELLEQQRLHLASIIIDDSILSCMTAEQQDALQGIQAMLDDWSDDQYYAKEAKKCYQDK